MNLSREESILFQPAGIATLVNEAALSDFILLLKTLQIWNREPPRLFVYCCSVVHEYIQQQTIYSGKIYTTVQLDAYKGLNRQGMEQSKSRKGRGSLFHDFTEEKCELMRWALSQLDENDRERGILFCDADILWLGSIPQIQKGKVIGLSQHMIRKRDEECYGEYNAGFLWTNSTTVIDTWKEACVTSRFFEQAALEDVAKSVEKELLHLFPEQINYGWWRLFQNENPSEIKKWKISSKLETTNTGIIINEKPLLCIHTHWKTTDATTKRFNVFVLSFLEKTRKTKKLAELFSALSDAANA